jgi:tRNA nucleotidyltransferase/poly(A) polymerase
LRGRVQKNQSRCSNRFPGPYPNLCRRLRDRGFPARIAGGSLRDLLLGRQPENRDIATDARPDSVERLFRRAVTSVEN